MAETLKAKPKYGVRLMRGLENDPADERYHVMVHGTIVLSTSVLAAAQIVYDETVLEQTTESRSILGREAEHFELQAVRSNSFERRAASTSKKGGRGGRGGV